MQEDFLVKELFLFCLDHVDLCGCHLQILFGFYTRRSVNFTSELKIIIVTDREIRKPTLYYVVIRRDLSYWKIATSLFPYLAHAYTTEIKNLSDFHFKQISSSLWVNRMIHFMWMKHNKMFKRGNCWKKRGKMIRWRRGDFFFKRLIQLTIDIDQEMLLAEGCWLFRSDLFNLKMRNIRRQERCSENSMQKFKNKDGKRHGSSWFRQM